MSRKSDHVTYIELGFSGTFDWHYSGCHAEAVARHLWDGVPLPRWARL